MSVSGLKSTVPASARATTVSGEVTKASVLAKPSLRFGKLRLYEVTIVLTSPSCTSWRAHCPMHGPQALARTVAPMRSKSASRPSRSMVARTCSLPGVIISSVRQRRPAAAAWRAMLAARVMSS